MYLHLRVDAHSRIRTLYSSLQTSSRYRLSDSSGCRGGGSGSSDGCCSGGGCRGGGSGSSGGGISSRSNSTNLNK
ncbi:unnamed protein product [Schistosoma margrebowiei]|uniref:Uncharacterized protein n=1 Tax=Schistosoma margrebowiei TaxID=48269 RepID=A0A183MNL5_9TREM|nr:unnamed protein product [Schistosoma margrebowiei]